VIQVLNRMEVDMAYSKLTELKIRMADTKTMLRGHNNQTTAEKSMKYIEKNFFRSLERKCQRSRTAKMVLVNKWAAVLMDHGFPVIEKTC
jgi:hypothetical protein